MMMVDPDCPHMTVYMANPRHDVDVYIYIDICIDIRYVYNTCTKKLGDAVWNLCVFGGILWALISFIWHLVSYFFPFQVVLVVFQLILQNFVGRNHWKRINAWQTVRRLRCAPSASAHLNGQYAHLRTGNPSPDVCFGREDGLWSEMWMGGGERKDGKGRAKKIANPGWHFAFSKHFFEWKWISLTISASQKVVDRTWPLDHSSPFFVARTFLLHKKFCVDVSQHLVFQRGSHFVHSFHSKNCSVQWPSHGLDQVGCLCCLFWLEEDDPVTTPQKQTQEECRQKRCCVCYVRRLSNQTVMVIMKSPFCGNPD